MSNNLVTSSPCPSERANKVLYTISLRNFYLSPDQLESILKELPRDKAGLIKIEDFFTRDIHSQEAFKVVKLGRLPAITVFPLSLYRVGV